MDKENKELEGHFINSTKQTGVVFVSKFLGYLLGFGINFVLARFYGAQILGQYTLINTYFHLMLIFTILGLDNGMIKYIAKYRGLNDEKSLYEVIKIGFIYTFVFSIIGAVLTFIFRGYIGKIFNDELLSVSLLIGSWIIIPKTLNRYFGGVYKGLKKIWIYILGSEILRRIIILLLLILFMITNKINIINVIFILLVSSLLMTIFFFLGTAFFDIKFKKIIYKAFSMKNNDKSIRNRLLAYSSTMILISFMNIILVRTDRIMLGIFSTTSAVGIYNIVDSIGRLTNFLLASSNASFVPIISELYSQKKIIILNKLYSTIIRWISIFTVPIVVTIVLFPGVILNIFGPEYLVAKNVLIILAFGQMINSFGGANGYILNMTGNEKLNLINNFVMGGLNVFLNFLLIPKYGILGAGIATTVSIVIINIIIIIQIRKKIDIFPYDKKFLLVILVFIINYMIGFIGKHYYNNIYMIILVTIVNFTVSLGLIYVYKDEVDYLLFKKLKNKIKFL